MLLVTTGLRILVASVFVAYGLEKLLDPTIIRLTLSRYLPGTVASIVAPALAVVEVIVGLSLLFGLATPISGIATIALLLAFTAVLIKGWVAGSGKSDCGCSKSPMPIRVAVVRNALLMIATTIIVILPTGRASPAPWPLEAGVAALIVGGVLLLARKHTGQAQRVSATHQAEVSDTSRMSRRGAINWLVTRGGAVLGTGVLFQVLLNSGHAFASYIQCVHCNAYLEFICNCGVTDVYSCHWYAAYNCTHGCYTQCNLIGSHEGC
jgi:uncharacterized membrane protein YphA (DoxX/SURF4 family)